MATFQVQRGYWMPKADLLVLTGHMTGDIGPGMLVDLPVEIRGPGPVPIASVELVELGPEGVLPAITIAHSALELAPLMEFQDLEGRALQVSPEPTSDP